MEPEPVYKTIGGIVRQKRRRLELPQAELARRLGISRATLANIETGRQRILVHQLYSLAEALDLKLMELLPPSVASMEASDWSQLPIPAGLKVQQKEQIALLISSVKQASKRSKELTDAKFAKTKDGAPRGKTA